MREMVLVKIYHESMAFEGYSVPWEFIISEDASCLLEDALKNGDEFKTCHSWNGKETIIPTRGIKYMTKSPIKVFVYTTATTSQKFSL